MTPSLISSPARSSTRAVSTHPIHVAIRFCEVCNYSRPARTLAAEIRREFPHAALRFDLEACAGGRFEVQVDGRLVFSKRATRRLPDKEEIFYHVQAALAGG